MPEAYTYSLSPEPPKKAAVIKISCGIGDTDGFPAFDVDSDAYACKDDSKWGFLITGGAEFHMPLTVFQVTPEGLADKAGIRLGDIILEINEEDVTQLTLAEAHEKIDNSAKKVTFLIKSTMELEGAEEEIGEEKFVVLRVPKPPPPPKAASIEARLMDMQRKLSEIAEIPKMLCSTLQTVSQTFDKLLPGEMSDKWRKLSYDEDVHDFELNALGNLTPRLKSSSPASDYDSETNDNAVEVQSDYDDVNNDYDEDYVTEIEIVPSIEEEEYDDIEEEEQQQEDEEEEELQVILPLQKFQQQQSLENEDEEEDFTTASFTWNLSKIPKLSINADNESEDEDEQTNKQLSTEIDREHNISTQHETNEKQCKQDKFERAWPWADRQKIIYKQSTCHLVPRRPLGLVEQRIQLLSKQQLMNKLQQATAKNGK